MIHSNVRITQIAEAAGVSASTVSRALNHSGMVKPETLKLILDAMEQLGVPPPDQARPSRGKRQHKQQPADCSIILCVIPAVDNPFYSDVLKGVAESVKSHGYHYITYTGDLTKTTISSFLSLVEATNVDGVLSISSRIDPDTIRMISELVPFVSCCEHNESAPASYVSYDDRSAARNVTEYIISTGHRKIAFINGNAKNPFCHNRYNGFLSAVEQAGITVPAKWIVNLPNLQYETACAAITQILTGDVIPNAIFAISDVMAVAALNVARNLNLRVPEDLIVVGFDDLAIASMCYPALTTVSVPKYQLGYAAAEILLEKIMSPDTQEKRLLLNAKLVIRGSSSINNTDRIIISNIP